MVRSFAILALAGSALAAPLLDSVLGSKSGLTNVGGVLGRDLVGVVAPVKAVVDAVVDDVTYADVYGVVDAANVGIKDSDVASNILNGNKIKIARDALVDVEATLYAVAQLLAKLCANAGVNVEALLANIKITDSSVASNILNGNKVHVARNLVDVDALIAAAIKALVLALVKLGVDVEACLANINISYSDILSGILQYNNISVASRSAVDVYAIARVIIQALVQACAAAKVDIFAAIANIDIKYSSVLSNILNGNKISVLSRDVPELASVVADILACITVLIQAAAQAHVDVLAELLNIGIDCSSILSNIGNNNNISVLSRDLVNALVTVEALVQALIQACLGVKADVAAAILNVVIQRSSIASNILNYNVVHVL